MQVTTTARFGPHEVRGVVMLHRVWLPSAHSGAAWLQAPIPISVDEIAAVLYEVFDAQQLTTGDLAEARQWVVEMVLNSGCTAIEETSVRVAVARQSGCLDIDRWEACLRLARQTVIQEPDP